MDRKDIFVRGKMFKTDFFVAITYNIRKLCLTKLCFHKKQFKYNNIAVNKISKNTTMCR